MNKQKAQLQELFNKLTGDVQKLLRYAVIGFFVFIGLLYGFLLLRINTLSNQQPSQAQISSQVKAAQIPHIDQAVVKQLQSLQDNSVSVQALFNQARSNPFQ